MGVFGLTIPEEFGGFGLSKASDVRGVRGTVARLYRRGLARHPQRDRGGADPLRRHAGAEGALAAEIASAEILPTAVFTEPNTGSDLGSLRTRAVRTATAGVTGNKTWITHAARTDVMTLLARTDPDTTDYRGLSMFLAKRRAAPTRPVPRPRHDRRRDRGARLSRHEGIRARLRRLPVKAENLLGGVEGQGFKQLMQTFESARIQTAARAVGVAQNALEVGCATRRTASSSASR
jgi:(2S)-methylsuccinyl-CoA dehydrogenase